MQKEAETLEQTIQHRKSEVQAAQKRLDRLKADSQRQTSALLKQQESELKVSRENYDKEITAKKTELEKYTTDAEEAKGDLGSFNSQVEQATNQLEVLINETKTVQGTLNEARSATESIKDGQTKLLDEKTGLLAEIESSKEHLLAVQKQIEELTPQKENLEGYISTLKTDLETKKQEKERTLANLDAKLIKVTQNIEKNHKVEEQIRDELAVWQKKLEQRDQNLKIREAKAAQSEDKIIRNSGLLNL